MSDQDGDADKNVVVHALNTRPETPNDQPGEQAEELMHNILVPLADVLRGLGRPGPPAWHPGAIYVGMLRAGALVLGTEWAHMDVALMCQAWDELMPVLREEMIRIHGQAALAYQEAMAQAQGANVVPGNFKQQH